MEIFTKSKVVKLRSHHDKYLVAHDDGENVRQSRNGNSSKARWVVDLVDGKNNIRLKSCHGRYLTASDDPFLLGMTGKRILQTVPEKPTDWTVEWEPIRDGFQVKFRSWCGKYLRANGGPPPWRNSVTHDDPYSGSTQNWVLWDVEEVKISESSEIEQDYLSFSSFSTVVSEDDVVVDSGANGSPLSLVSSKSDKLSMNKVVKLRSHHDKYLVADDNGENVRQSRNGNSSKARWVVELVDGKNNIRLKSCHGHYLKASDDPFLLGMTGKRIVQTVPEKPTDWTVEWEPIRDGFQVKLRSWCGKYLRANGGPPPWRNSVTHDDPYSGSTQNWILWDVEEVKISESSVTEQDYLSFSSFSTVVSEDDVIIDSGANGSPLSLVSSKSDKLSMNKSTNQHNKAGMEFFHNAKAVRLRSHHDKYLLAEEDEESVIQDRNGAAKTTRWTVEFVLNSDSIIRLKSCYGKYLTASNQPFLLGMTGRKVLQTLPRRLDSSVEWEPVRDGTHVKLKTRYGNYLRANGGLPPWRNSVTHDVPHRTSTQDWILWDVDVVEILVQSPTAKRPINPLPHLESMDSGLSRGSDQSGSPTSASGASGHFDRQESLESYVGSPPKSEGRIIYYHIADENGDVEGEDMQGYSFNFKGNNVEELTHKLEEETGMDGIVVCSRSPLNGKLFPLRLQLPPNTVNMHVVVVPASATISSGGNL